MKPFCYVSIGILACVGFPVHADSLDQIAAFAEKICHQSLSGGETSTTITANLNGDVNGLAKALGLSVGAGGLVKHDGAHYDGIPADKLPKEIPTEAQCRADLAKILILERTRLAAPPSSPQSSAPPQGSPGIFSANVVGNSVLISVMDPPPGNLTLLINDRPVISDGKDTEARLADIQSYTTHAIYKVVGSTADLNIRVGSNKVVVKYGTAKLPQYEFTLTETQREKADRISNLSMPNRKGQPRTGEVMVVLNTVSVDVLNPPDTDPNVSVNGKDVDRFLAGVYGNRASKFYKYEGSPEQLNLHVGHNKISVHFGSTALEDLDFIYTEHQRQIAASLNHR